MISIRPVSDLRNKFLEIESTIQETQSPVFLTKNGHGSMVLMSLEQYEALTASVEEALSHADRVAESTDLRYTKDQVFDRMRGIIYDED